MENTQSNTKTPSKKVLLGIAGVIALIAILAVMYVMFRPIPAEGSKSITIEVVGKDGRSEEYKLRTDAEYRRQAMEDADGLTFSGTESEYGMMVETVNGLDFNSTEFLYQLIAGYKKYGTVLFSSHILESVTLTCDRVLILEEGPPNKLIENEFSFLC